MRRRNPGQSEQFARLMLGRKMLRMQRIQTVKSEATHAHTAMKAQSRADARACVKDEIEAQLAKVSSDA
eukprot:980128-Pleurochrysis_carterae.AAC.1